MVCVTAKVGSAVGLHARPAMTIAAAVEELGSAITINDADAGSARMIMSLGVRQGDVVEVAGASPADVERIAALVEQELDPDWDRPPLGGGCI